MSRKSSSFAQDPFGLGVWNSDVPSAGRANLSRYAFKKRSLPPPGPSSSRPRTSPVTSRVRNQRRGQPKGRPNHEAMGLFVTSSSGSGSSAFPAEPSNFPLSKNSQSVVTTPFLAKLFHQQQDHLQQKVSDVTRRLSGGEEKENNGRSKVDLQPIHVELLKALAQNKHYWDALQVREEEIRTLKEKFAETKSELGSTFFCYSCQQTSKVILFCIPNQRAFQYVSCWTSYKKFKGGWNWAGTEGNQKGAFAIERVPWN